METFAARSLTGILSLTVLAGCGFGAGTGGGGGSSAPGSTAAGSAAPSYQIPSNVALRQIVIESDKLAVTISGGTQQVQCSGVFSDGHVRDLTHFAQWTVQDTTVATLDQHGVATPVAAGTTGISASFDGLTAQGTLNVGVGAVTTASTSAPAAPAGPTWTTDVFPLLETTLSCKTCHAPNGIGTVGGRMILTGNSSTDFTQLTTSGLVDTTNPSSSVILQKATNTVSHGGGQQIAAGSAQYTTLLGWITGGAPLGGGASAPAATPAPATAPDMIMVNPPLRNLVDRNQAQQLLVLAWWSATGATLDVTRSVTWSSSSSVASVDSYGLATGSGLGTVTFTCSWQGAVAQSQLAWDPMAPLVNGDMPSVVAVPGAGSMSAGTTGTGTTGAGTTGTTGTGTTGTGTTGTGTTGTASANPTWVTDVFPLFQNTLSCKACHQPGMIGTTTPTPGGGTSRMILTLVSATDYTQITKSGLINTASPASSVLLQNATGGLTHGGGAVLATSSAQYQTLLNWITAGAPMGSGTAPATPASPLPLSYTNTISVDLAACTVCHATNAAASVRQDPYLDSYARVMSNAKQIQSYILSNGQVGSMGRKAGMTLAQAQQAVADLQAWISKGYPQ